MAVDIQEKNGLCYVKMCGEKNSADVESAESFCEYFASQMETLQYERLDIYNADETGLFWRALPESTLALPEEKQTHGYKPAKDRMRVMVCGNADGSHKVPLFFVGKSQKPRCFHGRVPDDYATQDSAWMTLRIFEEWYDNFFVPAVEEKHRIEGRKGKVLLILDTAPSHTSPGELLLRQGGRFQVLYLPPNVTSLIQPVDQTVISNMKRFYRGQLLSDLLRKDNEAAITRQEYLKSYTIGDARLSMIECWERVLPSTVANSFNKLMKAVPV